MSHKLHSSRETSGRCLTYPSPPFQYSDAANLPSQTLKFNADRVELHLSHFTRLPSHAVHAFLRPHETPLLAVSTRTACDRAVKSSIIEKWPPQWALLSRPATHSACSSSHLLPMHRATSRLDAFELLRNPRQRSGNSVRKLRGFMRSIMESRFFICAGSPRFSCNESNSPQANRNQESARRPGI